MSDQYTFLILTEYQARMRDYLQKKIKMASEWIKLSKFGAFVEDTKSVNERISMLFNTPVFKCFINAEPLPSCISSNRLRHDGIETVLASKVWQQEPKK